MTPAFGKVNGTTTIATLTTIVGGGINDGGLAVFEAAEPSVRGSQRGQRREYLYRRYGQQSHARKKVAPDGTISTVAGSRWARIAVFRATAAARLSTRRLNAPQSVALDAAGNLYIVDTNNFRVRKVDGSGTITNVAGSGVDGYSGDGGAAGSARLAYPWGLAVDAVREHLCLSDIVNDVVRMVNPSGTISTVAGSGFAGYSGDGGPATERDAVFRDPLGVAVDAAGNLYIADRYNDAVRMVSASGIISTVAGNGYCCYGGDGGPATSCAYLDLPSGVAVDGAGNLYIADYSNNRVRKVDLTGTITTVAGNGSYGYSGDGGEAIAATLQNPAALAIDSSGVLAVVDSNNNAIRLLIPTGGQPVLTRETYT